MESDQTSPIDQELIDALRDNDLRRIRLAISFGADPNSYAFGDPIIEEIL